MSIGSSKGLRPASPEKLNGKYGPLRSVKNRKHHYTLDAYYLHDLHQAVVLPANQDGV